MEVALIRFAAGRFEESETINYRPSEALIERKSGWSKVDYRCVLDNLPSGNTYRAVWVVDNGVVRQPYLFSYTLRAATGKNSPCSLVERTDASLTLVNWEIPHCTCRKWPVLYKLQTWVHRGSFTHGKLWKLEAQSLNNFVRHGKLGDRLCRCGLSSTVVNRTIMKR